MTLPGNPDSFGGTPAGDPTAVPEQASAFVPVPSPDPVPLQPAWPAEPAPATAQASAGGVNPPPDPAPPTSPSPPSWGTWTPPIEPSVPTAGGLPASTWSPGPVVPPGQRPDSSRARSAGAGRGTVVAAAVLAAALAAGGTFGLVEATRPPASAAPTAAAAQLTSTASSAPATIAPGASGIAGQPIVQIAANAGPAVVTITDSSSGFGGGGTSIGSGFIVRNDGYILTNRHVIAAGGDLTVQLADGRQFDGTVVGTDPTHDLAVVKIAATGLPTLTLGNSDKLQIGQLAIAIGDPLGTFPGSVTSGVISGEGRSIDVQDGQSRQAVHLTGLLQTDTAINEGNSGGPLLNAGGQVIGINTATDSSAQGIGFAVPINTAATLLAQAEAGNATSN
jgi:putative serine protease PepD